MKLPEAIRKCDGSQKQLDTVRRAIVELLTGAACDEVMLRACFVAAVYKGYLYLIELLISQRRIDLNSECDSWYGNFMPLCHAIAAGHKDVVCLLMAEGANIKMADEFGDTPLHWAATVGHMEIVSILLDKGADIEAKISFHQEGYTALHCAAESGNNDVVSILLERGADFEARDDELGTPIHCASAHGHAEVVFLLLERGADIEAKDKDEYTALHYAARNSHKDVVALLLDRGADIESITKKLKTALELAVADDVKELLRDAKDRLDTARATLRNAASVDTDEAEDFRVVKRHRSSFV